MVVQELKLVVEESDVVSRLRASLGEVNQVRDVNFALTPGLVRIGGKFQAGLTIPFDTQWSVDVLEGGQRLGVKLAGVSVGFFGMSAATVTEQVMGALAQRLKDVAGISVEGDSIMLDPDILLAEKGIRLGAPISRIEIKQGCVELEVGGA